MKTFSKRLFLNYKSILRDFFTAIGTVLLIVKLNHLTISMGKNFLEENGWLVLILIALVALICSLWTNWPRQSFSYKLNGKDSFIEVKVGDAFKNEGALIIPINNQLDVCLNGNVKNSGSLQDQLIKNFYSNKDEHLKTDIEKKIAKKETYDIGTVVELRQKNKIFYLLVNSEKKENNRVKSAKDDFTLSVLKVFEYIGKDSGRNKSVTIPLINTGHGRVGILEKSTAIKEIINIYIEQSKQINIADKLIVSIPSCDVKSGVIDLDEINEFLKCVCTHYRRVPDNFSKGTGIG